MYMQSNIENIKKLFEPIQKLTPNQEKEKQINELLKEAEKKLLSVFDTLNKQLAEKTRK
jgi:hypothetical protein